MGCLATRPRIADFFARRQRSGLEGAQLIPPESGENGIKMFGASTSTERLTSVRPRPCMALLPWQGREVAQRQEIPTARLFESSARDAESSV